MEKIVILCTFLCFYLCEFQPPKIRLRMKTNFFHVSFKVDFLFEVILISSFLRQSTLNNVDCSEITTKSLFDGCSVAWNWLVLRNGKSLLNKKWKFCHQKFRNLGSFQMTNNIFWIIANYLPPPPLAVWVIKWPPSYPRKTH